MTDQKFRGKYRVDSARYQNWDYGNPGAYFVTIVTKNRDPFLGKIIDNQMKLSEIGKTVHKYWQEIPRNFPFIRLDEMVVMPNHIHGILWIERDDDKNAIARRDAINRVSTTTTHNIQTGGITKNHNPMLHDNLSRVIRWYKGRCTFEINKISRDLQPPFAWQPRFHDRIIRDNDELNRIREYIRKIPQMWNRDRNNQELFI